MDLTTLDRVREAMGIKSASADTEMDNSIKHIITGVSLKIERSPLFDRGIEQKARTEYFDVEERQKIFRVQGIPIQTTPTPLAYSDEGREFAAGTLIDSDCYDIKEDRGIFTFDDYELVSGAGALKIVYTGGLGLHTDRMIVTCVAGGSGSFTASEEVVGQTSGARGKYVSLSGTTLTISVLTGEFVTGEIVKGSTSATVRTISAITQSPIVMAYPDLAYACELQSMFMYQRRDTIGLRSAGLEGGNISTYQSLQLLPEVRDILQAYKVY